MDNTKLRELLQQALTSLCKHKKYYKDGFQKAQQRVGLQGQKRIFRKESAKNFNLINYLISDAFDSFSIVLDETDQNISDIRITDIKSFYYNYLPVLVKEYEDLHTIANALVVANARHYAELLYNKCECLMEYIKYYRRTMKQGDEMNWSETYTLYLLEHETTCENVHDREEKKEKEYGYDF